MKAQPLSWFYLILLSLIWGSSFILMKEGLVAFTSDEVAALRITIAFIALLPFMMKHYKNVNFKKDWKGLVIMGTFGNLIPAFLFTAAETQISSSLTGMLNALTPLFTILIGVLVFKTKIQRFQIVGVAIGLIGAVCLMGFSEGGGETKNIIYALLVVAATLCYAISVNGIKKYLSHVNSVAASVWAFTIVGPIAFVYLYLGTDFQTHFMKHPGSEAALGYISILACVGTAIAVILFNNLIRMSNIVFASSCTYLIPVVAIGWGLLDGETVTIVQFFSMGIVILGVWLINKKPSQKV
jgi:drug/metabolite transporter (DMT)-like permease